MGHGSATPFFQGQARLRAIQRLNLALFIHAEHHRLLWRIYIQAHDVGQFLEKLRIPRQLEGFDSMRFQIVTLPDIVDGGLADSLASGHEPATPLGHALGFAAERGIHNRPDLLRPISWFATSSRRHFPQTIQALLRKARPPQGDRLAIHLQALSDGIVGLPFGGRQHNLTSQGHLLRCAEGSQPLS